VITEHLEELVRAALDRAEADGALAANGAPEIELERPKRSAHGDWSTNVALTAAGKGTNPREVAEAIVKRLPESGMVARVEIAGPGFINFHLSPAWLHDVVRRAADASSSFGRSEKGVGTRVNVEYVSANPTGPVTVVLGRHAAVGDAIAKLLEATGHDVVREYYFNDAGRQVIQYGRSVTARYMQALGHEVAFPEDGYEGEYVTEIAGVVRNEVGDSLVDQSEEDRVAKVMEIAVPLMIQEIRQSLERFGTTFDVWFSEARLHESGEIDAAIEKLRADGLIEERDGALWFLSSRLGDDKDRVVIRSNGTPTYFAADLGYLIDKFRRGFDHLIYLWGSDHHGTIPRLMAAVEALGYSRSSVEIRLVQIVRLVRGGEAVRASKRAGVLLPLDELVDEVGVDAARYTFLTRSIDAPLDFDIDLVKEQAPENPVYYVQYAHARICSILRKATEQGVNTDVAEVGPALLEHPSENALMRKLASYEEMVVDAGETRAPQKVARYVEELASTFSAFYRDCKVISDDRDLTAARLALCVATKRVIADALGLLGVGAPESM
jgi:arginyl-tRNA synthetase